MQIEKQYYVGARELGMENKLTNYGFLAFLEDIAGVHSDNVGYGIKDIDKNKRTWILMDWKLHVIKRPGFGEKILVKTWSKKMNKPQFFSYRDFEVYDEEEELIAIATSKWVLFDVEKKRIAKIGLDIAELYNPEEKCVFGKEEIEKIKIPDTYESCIEYQVRRFDIDVNKHLHNLNYLNLAYEALPKEIYDTQELDDVQITYKHQIKLGDKVKCYYSSLDGSSKVVIKSEDGNTIHAMIELK